MNRLDSTTRAQIINCLIEGCSVRSTVRLSGAAKKTVMRVLVEVGAVCAHYQDHAFHHLKSARIQVDELWAFCYCKEKTVTPEIAAKVQGAGNTGCGSQSMPIANVFLAGTWVIGVLNPHTPL